MCVCTAVRLCAYVCECVYFSTLKPSHLYLIRTQYSYCEIVGRSVFHSMPFAVILDFFFPGVLHSVCQIYFVSCCLCMYIHYLYPHNFFSSFAGFCCCCNSFAFQLFMCALLPTKYKRFVCSVYYVLWSMVILQFYPVYWLTGPTVVHLVLLSISIDTTL